MLTGETKTGFKYAVDEAALNDWELLEDLDGIENNPQQYVRVAKRLLCKEQYEALKEHCINDNGRVDMTKMFYEISDILTSNNRIKN